MENQGQSKHSEYIIGLGDHASEGDSDNPEDEGAPDDSEDRGDSQDSDDQGASTARVPGRTTGPFINPPVPHIFTLTPERYPPLTPDEVSALPPRYATYVRHGLIINGCWSHARFTATQLVGVPYNFGESFHRHGVHTDHTCISNVAGASRVEYTHAQRSVSLHAGPFKIPECQFPQWHDIHRRPDRE